MVNVGVVGAGGRMGREVCLAVAAASDLELVALVDVRFHNPEPVAATLALLLVHPAHRRQGHAAALVTEIARVSSELGMSALHLGIRNGAAGANAFWEALGFEETGRGAGVTEYVRSRG